MDSATSLRFFITLCEKRSLSATAQALDISPSGATKRLGQIEQQMGVKLVNRTTRKISLTPEGEIYLEYAQDLLGQMEQMQEVKIGRAHV